MLVEEKDNSKDVKGEVEALRSKAKALYNEKKYAEALVVYRKMYAGYQEEFSIWDRRFTAFCIFHLEIKQKKHEEILADETSFYKSVDKALKLVETKDLVVEKVVFKVLDYLNSKKIYPSDDILSWLKKLDPANLSTEAYSFVNKEGRNIELASNKEKYYMLYTKALEDAKQYEMCIQMANEGLSVIGTFHSFNDVWLLRRIALSKFALGKKEDALEELNKVLLRKNDWFIYFDLAHVCLSLGQVDEAYQFAIDAALAFGEADKKIGLFFLMGSIHEKLQQLEEAKKYFQLVWQLRIENEWKIPLELQSKLEQYQIEANNGTSPKILLNELKIKWQQFKESVIERVQGQIKAVLKDGQSGFIVGVDQRDYYFRIKNIQDKNLAIKVGEKVTFISEKRFDIKRNADSFLATSIKGLIA